MRLVAWQERCGEAAGTGAAAELLTGQGTAAELLTGRALWQGVCWPGRLCWASAGRGAVAKIHREDNAGRGTMAKSHRENNAGRGADAESHRE